MLQPFKNGTYEDIQGIRCYVPPVGYVYDPYDNRKLHYVGIAKNSDVVEEQHWWSRDHEKGYFPDEPADFFDREEEEADRQQYDKEYVDAELEAFRQQEWNRRLMGFWFMNKGVPTYITGLHYFYLRWWHLDVGKPDYREEDRKYFYFLRYCDEDPKCLGSNKLTKRKEGKTVKSGVWLFDRISKVKEVRGGIQSKTADDAKEQVYRLCVLNPFRKLPLFFQPAWDTSRGDAPTTGLSFYPTSKKGKRTMKQRRANQDEALWSMIDWKNSKENAYDGPKLYGYIGDEVGKTEDVDIYERHNVIAHACMFNDEHAKLRGKCLYTTTVEDMKTTKNYLEFWHGSDVRNKENSRTATGLYKYYVPCYDTMELDVYGFPDKKLAIEKELANRKLLEHDTKRLNSYIRKNSFTEAEALRVDSDDCLFDVTNLSNRAEFLEFGGTQVYERGKFIWKDGKRDTQVVWTKDVNGPFQICWLPTSEADTNLVKEVGGVKYPDNRLNFVIGVDPFDHNIRDTTEKEYKLSKGAAFVLHRHNAGDSWLSKRPVVFYHSRPAMAYTFYEDMIKLAHYFGCQVLIEDNRIGIKHYFEDRGYAGFLQWLPKSNKAGITANESNKQEGVELVEEYIATKEDGTTDCDKINFTSLINQCFEFRLDDTQKYDAVMAFMWTLVADKYIGRKKEVKTSLSETGVESYFRKYKVRNNLSISANG